MFSASNTVRVFLFNVAVFNMVAIGLTGFGNVHWFSYVLPSFLVMAAITGFCPGLLISKRLLSLVGMKS